MSWRVLLLPFLGHQNLFDQFNRDEPWDSPTNIALLDQMPDVYRSLGDLATSTTTRIVRPLGLETATGHFNFPGSDRGLNFRSIADGASQTIFAIEAGADQAVPWTKPEDPLFDAGDPKGVLGSLSEEPFRAVFFDGSSAHLPSDLPEDQFAALVTRNGRELVDIGSIRALQQREQGQLKSHNQRVNEFKQVALAIQFHHDVFKRLPANTFAEDGTPLLSWQVQLLPFMEYQALYELFHHDEPWDSPHNLSLLPLMPDIFRSIGDPPDSTTTRMATFTGRDNTPFPSSTDANKEGLRLAEIIDGTSNTFAFVEAGPETAVPWTKPVDRPLPENNPFGPLGDMDEEFIAAYFDGHIETISSEVSPGFLRARITRNGAEILGNEPEVVVNPGLSIIESGGDTETNEFGVDSFYVVLDLAPASNVVIDVLSSDGGIATVDQPQLTFTSDNWDVPQAVAVRGVDNQTVNPDQTIVVNLSVNDALSDVAYQLVADAAVNVTITDDEPQPPALPGDFNLDGSVDAADYTAWRDQLGTDYRQPYRGADANGDGVVDTSDYALWRQNFGMTAPVASAVAATQSAFADLPTTLGSGGSSGGYPFAIEPEATAEAEPRLLQRAIDFGVRDWALLLLAAEQRTLPSVATIDSAIGTDDSDETRDSESEQRVGVGKAASEIAFSWQ